MGFTGLRTPEHLHVARPSRSIDDSRMCDRHFGADRCRADADDANHRRHAEPLTGHALESAIGAPVRLCEIPFVKERISPDVLERDHLWVTTLKSRSRNCRSPAVRRPSLQLVPRPSTERRDWHPSRHCDHEQEDLNEDEENAGAIFHRYGGKREERRHSERENCGEK
jgi:hypothetical protein